MRMTDALLLAFDTETTGPNPQQDRVVELGGVYLHKGEIESPPLRSLVNPGRYIPPGATHVHGIKNEDVEDAPPWTEVGAMFKKHIDVRRPILCGYNVLGFDGPLIDNENERNAMDWRVPRCLDPFVFVHWKLRGERTRKLGVMCEYFDIHLPDERAHSADADALVTGLLALAMIYDGMIPNDVEGAFAEQQLLETKLEAERARYGRYLYEDRDDGRLRLGLGKNTGTPVDDAEEEYLRWMLGRPDLPDAARLVLMRKLGRTEQLGLL